MANPNVSLDDYVSQESINTKLDGIFQFTNIYSSMDSLMKLYSQGIADGIRLKKPATITIKDIIRENVAQGLYNFGYEVGELVNKIIFEDKPEIKNIDLKEILNTSPSNIVKNNPLYRKIGEQLGQITRYIKQYVSERIEIK
jgi:hypothetical protein